MAAAESEFEPKKVGVAGLLTLSYSKDFFGGANMTIPGDLESGYSYLVHFH